MVYALLHRQDVFEPFRMHARFADILDNVQVRSSVFLSCNESQYTCSQSQEEKNCLLASLMCLLHLCKASLAAATVRTYC